MKRRIQGVTISILGDSEFEHDNNTQTFLLEMENPTYLKSHNIIITLLDPKGTEHITKLIEEPNVVDMV